MKIIDLSCGQKVGHFLAAAQMNAKLTIWPQNALSVHSSRVNYDKLETFAQRN